VKATLLRGAEMSLNTAVKNWLAMNAGKNNCFASSGVSYKDADGGTRTGSTTSVLSMFYTAGQVGKTSAIIAGNYSYNNLKSLNGGADITLSDVSWVNSNMTYCATSTTPSPPPTVTPTPATGLGINTAVKNWLAQNAGFNNCFAQSGVAFKDADGISRVGGTGKVLSEFYTAHQIGKDSAVIIANYSYTNLKTLNGYKDITMSDVYWVGANAYCAGQGVTPTPYIGPTGIPGDGLPFDFVDVPSGIPSVNLDLTELIMQQNSTDYHFEMNDVRITNNSPWRVYIAAEIKMFGGAQNSCPVSGAVFNGLNRASSTDRVTQIVTRNPRYTILDKMETAYFNLDFYQPSSIKGLHTVCLIIHGAYTRDEIVQEVSGILG